MAIHETTVTETLEFFFNEVNDQASKNVKDELLDFLLEKTDVKRSNLSSKCISQGKSKKITNKPDLSFEGSNEIVFIEVKINDDDLTNAQKDGKDKQGSYLENLYTNYPDFKKALIFIIPSGYPEKKREEIPNDKIVKIIEWVDVIRKFKKYDNPRLNMILELVNDYSYDEIASNNDMKRIPFQLRENFEWVKRVTNRLKRIVENLDYESFKYGKKGKTYTWDDIDAKNDNNIKKIKSQLGDFKTLISIYAGVKLPRNRYISVNCVEQSNHLIINTNIKLPYENVGDEFGLGKQAYRVEGIAIDSSVDDVIAAINKMFEKKEK